MCHGHPRYHSCAHTSMKWHYCPSAFIDLETGYQTACNNVSFAPSQSSSASCPLQTCYFNEKGGRWTCCQCKQGPNTQGWCTGTQTLLGGDYGSYVTCDHGCCRKCIRLDDDHSFEAASPSSSGTNSSYGSYESDMQLPVKIKSKDKSKSKRR